VRLAFTVDSLTEVLVIRDEDPIVGECFLDDVTVIHATRFLVHRQDIVSTLP
jgi:hypothetical protein